MAQALDVGLDELVFGDPKPTPVNVDPRAMAEYLDAALLLRERRDNNRAEVTGMLIEHLVKQVKDLAETITEGKHPLAKKLDQGLLVSADCIDVGEIVQVAEIAQEVFTLSLTLRFTVGDMIKGGQLLQPAITNIKKADHHYRYLIPENVPGLEDKARWLSDTLRKAVNDDVLFERNCQFRVTKTPVFGGATLYRLDRSRLGKLPLSIKKKVETNLDTDNWFGAFHGPWAKKDLNPVMDQLYLSRARQFVEDVWDNKKLTHRLKAKRLGWVFT